MFNFVFFFSWLFHHTFTFTIVIINFIMLINNSSMIDKLQKIQRIDFNLKKKDKYLEK